jgi:uncharacterized protein YdaU (DUF1376 family)
VAKDPAFLFYPNDYLGGTLGMTFEEKGAYIELLMLQFNRGHMDGHMVGQTVGQIFGRIQNKFIVDDNGLYYNERLEYEINKRKQYTESRKNNLTGYNQHTKKRGHMGGVMTSHMENENEDINIDVIKDLKGVKGGRKKGITPPTLEDVKNYCAQRKNNVDAKMFWESYDVAGWYDSTGKPVLNWKQKIINVWERGIGESKPKKNNALNYPQRDVSYLDERVKY